MQCLLCETEMLREVIDGVEIDLCPECEGIWLDEGEFQKLTSLDVNELDTTDGRDLKCPKCTNTMTCEVIDLVEIDRCPECNGIWLDEGELMILGGAVLKDKARDKMLGFLTARRELLAELEASLMEED